LLSVGDHVKVVFDGPYKGRVGVLVERTDSKFGYAFQDDETGLITTWTFMDSFIEFDNAEAEAILGEEYFA
jgi:hypothetical protein